MAVDGRRYVVLGATGGIGRAVAERLAAGGAKLVLGARSAEPLKELADELGAVGHPLDARDLGEVDGIVDRALEEHGGLDGVVNAVGSIVLKPAHITRGEELREILETNLVTAFAAVRSGARVLREGGGSVVLFSTAAVRSGIPNHEAIAAAKGGVEGLTRAAAATYAGSGVRVNAVAPGLTRTAGADRIISSESARKASEAMHALGRLGEPEEVASAAVWLLDPDQSWVTGQVLGVDGGLGTLRPAPGGSSG
ncbi:MAG: SDR family oxidoreductase [Longimicrobiales bacterium]|nr:SDR family oxidoreductase [Longimicrobiales bacterium]